MAEATNDEERGWGGNWLIPIGEALGLPVHLQKIQITIEYGSFVVVECRFVAPQIDPETLAETFAALSKTLVERPAVNANKGG